MFIRKSLQHVYIFTLSVLFLSPNCFAATEPSLVNVYDEGNYYHFGSGRVITIDTAFIDEPIYTVLVNHNADSVVRLFPNFLPSDTLYTRPDGKVKKLVDMSRHYIVYFSGAINQAAFDSEYKLVDAISSLSPIPITTADSIPSDLDSANQIYMFADTSTNFRINATEAWDVTTGSSTQEIAVLDLGIDDLHPEFAGRITGGYSPEAGAWNNGNGHGTATSGIIISNANDVNSPMAGINWDAKLFFFKATGPIPWSVAFDSAQKRGSDIISMAQSTFDDPGGFGEAQKKLLADIVYNLWIQDMTIVTSKGNENTSDRKIPADFPMVVGVGALDVNGDRLNIGPGSGSNTGGDIWFAAPGQLIAVPSPSGGYSNTFQGTSAAEPVVAGVLSLIQAANPDMLADEVEQVAILTANDVDETGAGWDPQTGWGVPDVGKAVKLAARHNHLIRKNVTTSQMTPNFGAQRTIEFTSPGGTLSGGRFNDGQYSSILKTSWTYEESYAFGHTPIVLIRMRSTSGWELDSLNSDTVVRFPWAQATVDSVNKKIVITTGAYLINGLISGNPDSLDGWWPCDSIDCQNEPSLDVAYSIAVCSNPGDANNDCSVNIADVTYMIARIFSGGPDFPIRNDADVNPMFSCGFNIADLTYMIAYIQNSGPAPVDNNCSPGSLKPTAGGEESFVFAADVALDVGAKRDNKRMLKL